MPEESQTAKDRKGIDRINANFLVSAGNRLGGMELEEIGENGHDLANRLWKVAAYLRTRNDGLLGKNG